MIATSPASSTPEAANTSSPCSGCHGLSRTDAERIASGAKRAPGRQLVAVSKGAPTTAAAHCGERLASSIPAAGRPAKVRTPV